MADADLRRLAYLMLAPSLGRRRRLDLASSAAAACRDSDEPVPALVREVLRATAGRTGLVLLERGEANRELSALPPAARIACVLEHAAGLSPDEAAETLRRAEVTDPETAIALAGKSPLSPTVLSRLQLPRHGGPRASVAVGAAAALVALGVAIPVVASSGDHATDTGVSRPLQPAPARPAAPEAVSPAMAAELGGLLVKIDQRLAGDTDGVDHKRLQKLRDAIAAKLAQLPR